MAVSKSKKRYMVSLTPSVVIRFQSLARDLGMPASVMSTACEDSLKSIADVFQTAKDKGSIDTGDLFRLLGQQMDLIKNEEKEEKNVPKQKRNSVRHAQKPA